MSVRFRSGDGVTDIEIQNPERDNALEIDLHQAVNMLADGLPNVYELGVTTKTIRLAWTELRQAEKALLEAFFETTAEGAKNLFLYRDHTGAWWNAHFLSGRLAWTEVDDYKASSATFTIGATSYPTTQREYGIWATQLDLLLTAAGSTTA